MAPHAPKVSVIVPAYDAAWCIGRLLDSIAAQSLTDFEAIVVDDGSTDGTAAIVRSFAARDSRFRLVEQQNAGPAAARNRGIAEAAGEYLAPVDADDLWHRDYLRQMTQALDAPQAAKSPFAFCYSCWIDEDDRFHPAPLPPSPPRADFIGLLRCNAVGNGSCAVFRRERVLQVGGYDATLRARGARGGEDWKLVLELAALGQPVVTPSFLVGYRRTDRSLSADPMLQARSSLIVLDDLRKRFPKVPRRHFWAARTDFLVWVLPNWARRGDGKALLKYGVLAYLANPFWIASPQARHLLSRMLRALFGRRQAAPTAAMVKFGDHAPGGEPAAGSASPDAGS